jgi:hypothetical protein
LIQAGVSPTALWLAVPPPIDWLRGSSGTADVGTDDIAAHVAQFLRNRVSCSSIGISVG